MVALACIAAAVSACLGPLVRHDPPRTPTAGHEWTEPVTGMVFVWVPPGCFLMGSAPEDTGHEYDEAPRRRVCVDGFWLGKYEVTVAEYGRYLESTTGGAARSFRCDDSHCPVAEVSWFDASAMARWLSSAGHRGYRLPTEAEWEFAARAGGTTAYGFGDHASELDGYGWFMHNADDRVHPVGEKLPNRWGLHDMHGNVYEWVADWYGVYPPEAERNPSGPATGQGKVRRGGSWSYPSLYSRSAFRYGDSADARRPFVGFRLVMEASAEKSGF